MDDISEIMEQLSSKNVAKRKRAIIRLKRHLRNNHLARLCLHYISEHDPCYTVRNIARQAFYVLGEPPSAGAWEKHHLFHSE